jgi:hypothetical protein
MKVLHSIVQVQAENVGYPTLKKKGVLRNHF